MISHLPPFCWSLCEFHHPSRYTPYLLIRISRPWCLPKRIQISKRHFTFLPLLPSCPVKSIPPKHSRDRERECGETFRMTDPARKIISAKNQQKLSHKQIIIPRRTLLSQKALHLPSRSSAPKKKRMRENRTQNHHKHSHTHTLRGPETPRAMTTWESSSEKIHLFWGSEIHPQRVQWPARDRVEIIGCGFFSLFILLVVCCVFVAVWGFPWLVVF